MPWLCPGMFQALATPLYHVMSTIGFSAEVDHQLAQVAQLETSQEFQKCILLLTDEMYCEKNWCTERTQALW